MHRCFVQKVMFGGTSENELLSILKGLIVMLKQQESLTNQEQADVLKSFWKEYNLGCSTPMTDDYIEKTLIPAVLSYPHMDTTWAMTIIELTKMGM